MLKFRFTAILLAVLIVYCNAQGGLRDRLFSLRKKAQLLRNPTPAVIFQQAETTPSMIDVASEILPSTEAPQHVTSAPEVLTTTSFRRKAFPGRSRGPVLGRRAFSSNSRASNNEAEEKKLTLDKKKAIETPSEIKTPEPKKKSGLRRPSLRTSFRGRSRSKLFEVEETEENESVPNVVEAPPPPSPTKNLNRLRRPSLPKRHVTESDFILTPEKIFPKFDIPFKDTNAPVKNNIEDDIRSNFKLGNTFKPKNADEEFVRLENKKPAESLGTFSYKFVPKPNPLRNLPSFRKEHPSTLQKASIENEKKEVLFEKFFDSADLPKNGGEIDGLQTSETRTRSKIEIKEVNGTLYEYEYIYYYDDELPLYDYDTPVISDYDTVVESSSTAPVTTTKASRRANARTPPRPRSRPKITKENNEIKPTEKVTQPPALTRPKNRPLSTRGQTRSRGGARFAPSPSTAAPAPVDNTIGQSDVENIILPAQTRFPPRNTSPLPTLKESDIEFNVPVIGSSVVTGLTEAEQEFLLQNELLLDDVLDATEKVPMTEVVTDKDSSLINLYALSRAADADGGETTTIYPDVDDFGTETPIEKEIDLLYDYDLSFTDLSLLDYSTTAEYEIATEAFTPSPSPPPTTTTTTITTTTTSPPPTTTTTTATTPASRLGSRTRSRGSSRFRGRGRPRTRQPITVENEVKVEDVSTKAEESEILITTTTTAAPKIPARPVRTRGNRNRLNRLNFLRNRKESTPAPEVVSSPDAENAIMEDKAILTEKSVVETAESPIPSTTVATKPKTKLPPQRRQRPNRKNSLLSRFRNKVHGSVPEAVKEEKIVEESKGSEVESALDSQVSESSANTTEIHQSSVAETSTTTVKPKRTHQRGRKRQRGRFNRNRASVQSSRIQSTLKETGEVEDATMKDKLNETESSTMTSKTKPAKDAAPAPAASVAPVSQPLGATRNRNHRFRSRNRNPSRRFQRLPQKAEAEEKNSEVVSEMTDDISESPVMEKKEHKVQPIVPEASTGADSPRDKTVKVERTHRFRSKFAPGSRPPPKRRQRKKPSSLFGTSPPTIEVSTDDTAAATVSAVASEIGEVKEVPEEGAVVEVSAAAEPEPEPEPEATATEEVPVEEVPITTTESIIAKRQRLAQRRAQFLKAA